MIIPRIQMRYSALCNIGESACLVGETACRRLARIRRAMRALSGLQIGENMAD